MDSLSLYEFNTMNDTDKANAVWSGMFLIDRPENGYMVQLYRVSDFFVEVYYHIKKNEIERFKAFKKGALLEKYAENIQLRFS